MKYSRRDNNSRSQELWLIITLRDNVHLHSRTPHDDYQIEARDVARYAGAGVPPWRQAWGWDSSESAWWLGCSSRDPAGPSPNERREALPQWAHHLQGEP
ncbi:hypothetical protein ILYODFUR_033729 [Ilyodon furcidens]|uniref:Uncharacterized protein n=1 Tax=Ilyodon furcidens TaxID=33524 RepID=A0ABV0U479_9TELE